MSDSGILRRALDSLAARSRRRMIRRLLKEVDIRELDWMPPEQSPLAHAGSTVRLAMDYVIGPRTLAFGHWHDEHCALIREQLRDDRRYHLVDVGANAGLVSRQLLATPRLQFCGADCFEPDPDNYALLQHNLKPFADARLHAAALSNHDGYAEIFRSGRNAGDISLTPDAELRARSDLQARRIRLLDAAREGQRILDALPDGARLVWKSDTQGHDLTIAAALPEAFWQRVDVALIEITSNALPSDALRRFEGIVASFSTRRSVKFGSRTVEPRHVTEFVARNSGSEMDLLLAR